MSTMRIAALLVLIVLLLAAIAWHILQAPAGLGGSAPTQSPQEILYEECVAKRDREIHENTFATIDNPDVQREVLATRKDIAKRECREMYL
jgi:hypothetical protein